MFCRCVCLPKIISSSYIFFVICLMAALSSVVTTNNNTILSLDDDSNEEKFVANKDVKIGAVDVDAISVDNGSLPPRFVVLECYEKGHNYNIEFSVAIKKSWIIKQAYSHNWSRQESFYVPCTCQHMEKVCGYFYDAVDIKEIMPHVVKHLLLNYEVEETRRKAKEDRELMMQRVILDSGILKQKCQEITEPTKDFVRTFHTDRSFTISYGRFGLSRLSEEDKKIFNEQFAQLLEAEMKEFQLEGAITLTDQYNEYISCNITMSYSTIRHWQEVFQQTYKTQQDAIKEATRQEEEKLRQEEEKQRKQREDRVNLLNSIAVEFSYDNNKSEDAKSYDDHINGLERRLLEIENFDLYTMVRLDEAPRFYKEIDDDTTLAVAGDVDSTEAKAIDATKVKTVDATKAAKKKRVLIKAKELKELFDQSNSSVLNFKVEDLVREQFKQAFKVVEEFYSVRPDLDAKINLDRIASGIRVFCQDFDTIYFRANREANNFLHIYINILRIVKNFGGYLDNTPKPALYIENDVRVFLGPSELSYLQDLCHRRFVKNVRCRFVGKSLHIQIILSPEEQARLQQQQAQQQQSQSQQQRRYPQQPRRQSQHKRQLQSQQSKSESKV